MYAKRFRKARVDHSGSGHAHGFLNPHNNEAVSVRAGRPCDCSAIQDEQAALSQRPNTPRCLRARNWEAEGQMSKISTLSLNPAEEASTEEAIKTLPTLGFWKVALAVFVGNILTGLLAAFLYSLR